MWHKYREEPDGRVIWCFYAWGTYPNATVFKYLPSLDFVWDVMLDAENEIGSGRAVSLEAAKGRALVLLNEVICE